MPLLICHRLLLVLLLCVAAAHGDSSGDTYEPSMCLNQTYICGGMNISYLFYLSEETKDLQGNDNSYCGYPGMGILCNDNKPILQLNGTANYTLTVKSIQGTTANVSLADPEVVDSSCPRVDHNVTFAPGSWLEPPDSTIDYIFFYLGCNFADNSGLVQPSEIGPITCQEFDSGYPTRPLSFVIPDDKVPPGNWSLECNKVIQVPVLKHDEVDPKGAVWRNNGYGELLRRGFQLSWDKKPEQCMQCERSNGGRCAYKQTGEFLGCLCSNGRVNDTDCANQTDNSTAADFTGLLVGLAVGGGISLICLVSGIMYFKRTLKNRQAKILKIMYFKQNRGLLLQQLVDKDIAERMIFSLEELEKATNKFDEACKLGGGGHGTVYKGILSNKDVVAIKKSKITIQREIEDFINEVAILSQINHRNVVRLFGCCLETQVPLLVYEFISNGTLSEYLHVEGALTLSWGDRLRISLETASALAYLHSSALTSIIHRDVKSANILLDRHLVAKVSDFGASRGIPIDQTGVTTAIQGTFGYLDPEYYQTSRLTDKSDVYSFGVILVELLTRKKPYGSMHSEGVSLIAQFNLVISQDKLCDILDPQVISECLGGAKVLAALASTCLNLKGDERPTMRQVEMALERLLVSNKNSGQGRSTELNCTPTQISNNNDNNSRQYSTEQALLLSPSFPR